MHNPNLSSSSPFPLSRLERWENRLKAVFDEIDDELEAAVAANPDAYPAYPRHPARPPAGATANPEDDGLFDIGASFTAGFGSQHGPGYVLQARIATLDTVSLADQAALELTVVDRLRQKLPQAFPNAHLTVSLDHHVYKIHGDLSLDPV